MMAALASLAVVTIALRCLWLWQPERQLLLHQAHLRSAIERRDWGRIEALVDPAYADRWGYTRPTAVRDARQWLGQFFSLTVTAQSVADQLTADGGTVTRAMDNRRHWHGGCRDGAGPRECDPRAIRLPMEAPELEAVGLDAGPGGQPGAGPERAGGCDVVPRLRDRNRP